MENRQFRWTEVKRKKLGEKVTGTYTLDIDEGVLYAKRIYGLGNRPAQFEFSMVPRDGEVMGITYVPDSRRLEDFLPDVDGQMLNFREYLENARGLPEALQKKILIGCDIAEAQLRSSNRALQKKAS